VQDIGNVLQKALNPEAFNAGREACVAMWSGTRMIEGELALQARDGTPRRAHYRCWLPAMEDSGRSGGPAGAQAVLVDLTAIRQAEEALAAELERLSVTLQAMAEGVITTDAQGVVQYINEAAEYLTGWTAAGAIGRRIEDVCALRDATTRAPVPVPVAAALAGRSFADLPLNTLLVDRVNAARSVEGRCAPIHDLRDRIAGAVLVLRDVTQHARLEADMIRASKLESIGMLAGGIAHDFNNLLTGVLGNVSLATLDVPPGTGAVRWLREAEKGLLRTRDLTQQLLTFSKGGAPVLETVDLAEVVRETAQFALHGANVRGVFVFEPELRVAQADKGQIGQVVQNLVLNAVQAMPDGGEVRIALRNERLTAESSRTLAPGDYLLLEIADTGMGISPEHLTRVFEPYFTTKATGIGLGLATVYSIVRQHRGQIEVESEPGRGTTFRCWLPAAPQPAPNRPESGSPFPAKTKGRLLFMDDEEPIRTMAQALLSRLGFTVAVAANGEEALRLFTAAIAGGAPFDLVIMDLTVPGGMGGKETIVELRKFDPGVRAIVSSGYSSDPVMANHRAHGFQAMVPKPYRMADLAKAIARVMEEPA
jgi:signal transduction histidine kinase/ActR/RegA family two-component response regulator